MRPSFRQRKPEPPLDSAGTRAMFRGALFANNQQKANAYEEPTHDPCRMVALGERQCPLWG